MKNIKVNVMAIMLVVVMVFTGCATQHSDIKIKLMEQERLLLM